MEPEEFVKLETDEELLAALHCGFELETQEFRGTTWNQAEYLCQEDKPLEVDNAAWSRALDAHMLKAQTDPVWLLSCLDNPEINFQGLLCAAVYCYAGRLGCHKYEHPIEKREAMARTWAEEMQRAGSGVTLAQVNPFIMQICRPVIFSAMRRWFVEHAEPMEAYAKRKPYDTVTELLELPPKLLAVQDGSVCGPELITDGAVTVKEFRELAAWCFGQKPLIDEHCSFHISLSIPGVLGRDRNWGDLAHDEKFQMAAQEALLLWRDEWPRAVVTRARNAEWMQQYAAVTKEKTKYALVANRVVRWEFRLWGNVRTLEDAMKCLVLSARAYRHAWRVRLGHEPLLINSEAQLIEEWRKAV